jgi:hypothetical protein
MVLTKFGVIGDIRNKKHGPLKETLNKIIEKLMTSLKPTKPFLKTKKRTWRKKP